MIRIKWTKPAVSDLESIQDYIARDSAEYAGAVVERLVLSVDQLVLFPESGRLVPEATDSNIRELLVQNYRVIYRLKKGSIQILAIVHGARNLLGIKRKPWADR